MCATKKTTHTHQINGGAVQLMAENTYDELGQLMSKKVGNTSAAPLQKVDYSYNIRGWMKSINNPTALQQGSDPADVFGFKINYNTVEESATAANKLYNGNIAETFWSTATDGGFVRNYGYKYDQLNRLKDATYQKSNVVTNMYNENLTYDKNGNIMTLKRNGDRDVQTGTIGIDNLSYGYATNSNKLMTVVDNSNNTSGFNDFNKTGNDYTYDANGNMTLDKNKKITSIVYNHLNLPTKIVFATGNIVYIYNAAGQKVQKVVTTTTPASVVTTDYLGGYQYKNTVLQYFPTAEGYVKNTPVSGSNTYSYVYNYTDHLGNTRLSYTKDATTGSLKILDENNYYPFGLKHNGYNPISPVPENRRLFNGKELQDELGLDMYDYGARMLDRQLGIWRTIDPLAEKFSSWNPYNYTMNNPINLIDSDGKEAQRPPSRGTKEFNEFVKNIVNGNKGQVVNWIDKDGSWTYNAKNQTWVGIGESKGNDISFNNKRNSLSISNGFTIWGADRSGDTTGQKGITTDSFDSSDIPSIGGSAGKMGESLGLGKLIDFISNFLNGVSTSDGVKGRIETIVGIKNINETNKKEENPASSSSSGFVRTSYDPKTGNSTWVRKDVYDAQQKKKL